MDASVAPSSMKLTTNSFWILQRQKKIIWIVINAKEIETEITARLPSQRKRQYLPILQWQTDRRVVTKNYTHTHTHTHTHVLTERVCVCERENDSERWRERNRGSDQRKEIETPHSFWRMQYTRTHTHTYTHTYTHTHTRTHTHTYTHTHTHTTHTHTHTYTQHTHRHRHTHTHTRNLTPQDGVGEHEQKDYEKMTPMLRRAAGFAALGGVLFGMHVCRYGWMDECLHVWVVDVCMYGCMLDVRISVCMCVCTRVCVDE